MKTQPRLAVFADFLADYYGASLVQADNGRLISPELWQEWSSLQAAIDNQAYAIFRSEQAEYYGKALGLLFDDPPSFVSRDNAPRFSIGQSANP